MDDERKQKIIREHPEVCSYLFVRKGKTDGVVSVSIDEKLLAGLESGTVKYNGRNADGVKVFEEI